MSRKLRILMVEDSAADVDLIEHELRKACFNFSTGIIHTESDFVGALNEAAPDVVLADYSLPEFTGQEALHLFRKKFPDLPFIFVSGTIGEEKAIELVKLGATDFVPKKRLANLASAIQRALREVGQVAEKRRAEASLRESESRFRAVFEGAGTGIAIEDLQGKIIESNRALEQMLGYDPGELRQFTRRDFTHSPDQHEDHAQFNRLLSGAADSYQVEKRFVRKDGRIIWGKLTVSVVRRPDGSPHFALVLIEDITERQRTEEALVQYAALIESSYDSIISVTFDGVIFGWNPAAERVYGYSAREANGRSLSIITPPEKERESSHILDRIKHGERIESFETVRRHKDGSPIEVSITMSPIKDAGGKFIGASAISRDISHRTQAEEALRRSEASLARAQRIARLGSWELDLKTDALVWSDETYRIFGLGSGEFEGTSESFFQRVHPDDRDLLRQAKADAVNHGKPYRVDHRIVLPNGEIKNVNEQAEVVFNEKGAPVRFIGTVLDITDRKRAENRSAAFSQLGQRLSSATTTTAAARIIVEVADKLHGWDSCGIDLCSADQKTVSSILGIDLINGQRVDVTGPYANASPSRAMRQAMEQGAQLILRKPPYQTSHDFKPFGDSSRPSASLMFVPVRNGERIIGVLGIQSYSPNAYTQEDLQTLQALADHCGGALERIRAAIENQNLEAQLRQAQKMESVGQLAGGVAHDFNNLLTVIQGHVALLMMGAKLPEDALESARQISLAAERAANLTRQLLTFSRRQVIQPRNLDLNEVVNNMTNMLRRLLGEDITLQVNYAPALPLIHADPGMMEQILLNLSVNSRDAMPKGGGLFINTSVVTFNDAQARRIPDASTGDYVCLTVKDTGTGIPAENLPHIFEPFYTTKDVGKGTGLGLATVYGIVKQHRGCLRVHSQMDRETIFEIFLPVIAEKTVAAAQHSPEPPIRGGNETVLVVEDEGALRHLVRGVLQRYGYRVLEAANGVAALDVWEKHRDEIQLLLTDMVMPQGISGRDLAAKLLAEKPALKIIYSSGYSLAVVGADMVLQEGLNFLQKPYHPRKLAQTIRDCLDA
jgi:PAS domain S-box-containing protein